jgi:short-subunit dehydrogenase
MVAFTQILAAELESTGVKVQVVCPGIVATEFHTVQGMDLSHVPRLMPDDMVKGSLHDLDAGVVVSIPTLEDLSAFAEIDKAHGQLLSTALRPSLASRYGRASDGSDGSEQSDRNKER